MNRKAHFLREIVKENNSQGALGNCVSFGNWILEMDPDRKSITKCINYVDKAMVIPHEWHLPKLITFLIGRGRNKLHHHCWSPSYQYFHCKHGNH